MIDKPSEEALKWAIEAAEGGQFYSSVTLNKYRQWADEQIEKLRDVCKRRDGQLADAAQQLEQAESQRDDAVAERDRARKVADEVLLGVANTPPARKKLLDAEAAVAAYKRENESLNAQLAKQRRMVAGQDRREEDLRRTLVDTRTDLRRAIEERERLDLARNLESISVTESDPDMKTEVLTSACRDFAALSHVTQRALIDWATEKK